MLLPAKVECRINKLILAVSGFFNFSEGSVLGGGSLGSI